MTKRRKMFEQWKMFEKGREGKEIVLTFFGEGDAITNISVNLFGKNAIKYCENINRLALKDGEWVHAAIIEENAKIALRKPPLADKNIDVLKLMDDRSIQKMLREVDAFTLVKALKGADDETRDTIFRNVSPRAAEMLKEDMEFMGPVKASAVKSAEFELLAIINRLVLKGEIDISIGDEDVYV